MYYKRPKFIYFQLGTNLPKIEIQMEINAYHK
jgi:hypothetical protein